MADVELPLSGHLEELRTRLGRALLATVAAFALCYPATAPIFEFLTAPLREASEAGGYAATLIGTGVAEAFFTRLKVAFIAGVFLSLPVILYQAWRFTLPALREHEVRYAGGFVLFGTLFFFAGASFCYLVVFPFGFPFLLREYGSIGVDPTIRIAEYLSFTSRLLLAFGLTFEMPVATFFFARVGLLTHRTLLGWSRYAVVAMFVVSAVLTPPDVASQVLMAVPMLGLYALSIGVAYFAGRE